MIRKILPLAVFFFPMTVSAMNSQGVEHNPESRWLSDEDKKKCIANFCVDTVETGNKNFGLFDKKSKIDQQSLKEPQAFRGNNGEEEGRKTLTFSLSDN